MRRNPDYMLKEVADAAVIVPVGRAALKFPGMISVNETGRILWELLAEERTEGELRQLMYDRYDAPPEQIAADLSAFLRRLRLAGALMETDRTER